MPRRKSAFTLVELLAVVGIIALLIAMLLPALQAAKDAANKAVCASNLRQIVTAIRLYASDNREWTPVAPNYGHWELPPGNPLKADDPHAYWGIAYLKYVANKRALWICPSAKYMDIDPGYSDNSYAVTNLFATYGINCYVTQTKISRFKNQSELIVCQDAWEHRLDDNGDFLSFEANSSDPRNLTQYRDYVRQAVGEYYRHRRYCNVAWMDDHVTSLYESLGQDVPRRWYTGGLVP